MNVAVSELRANLSAWVRRAQQGEDVVITDRGTPVARITPIVASTLLAELEQNGQLSRPQNAQRKLATGSERVTAQQSVSDLVSEQRD